MVDDSWDSLDDIKTWHLNMTFHYVCFQNFEPCDYNCPYLLQLMLIFLVVLILNMMMVGVKIIYDFGCSSFKCKSLAWVIGLNAPNPSSDHHPFLNFGYIIPNLKPP
jgi:hypothetical protein